MHPLDAPAPPLDLTRPLSPEAIAAGDLAAQEQPLLDALLRANAACEACAHILRRLHELRAEVLERGAAEEDQQIINRLCRAMRRRHNLRLAELEAARAAHETWLAAVCGLVPSIGVEAAARKMGAP